MKHWKLSGDRFIKMMNNIKNKLTNNVEDFAKCEVNDCLNGGKCVELGIRHCFCPGGFTGDRCQTTERNTCESVFILLELI